MKKLGLIGGVGPESTIPYYHDIVYGVQKALDKPYFPPLTVESMDTFTVLRLSAAGDRQGLADYLLGGIRSLAGAGAEFAAIASNTAHMVFDEVQALSPIPLVSILEATCREAQRRGLTRLGVLGTYATMEGDFFQKPFARAGIACVMPRCDERRYVAQHISDELELGVVRGETLDAFLSIIDRMIAEDHIQAVVLGCTELPILFQGATLPIPVLDTMRIHIDTLVREILSK